MSDYRWNAADLSESYDQAAEHIHPYYRQIQAEILKLFPMDSSHQFLLVDAGAGAGRLVVRLLTHFRKARAILVDRSQPFLDLARNRLRPFSDRVCYLRSRLQEDWFAQLGDAPQVIVSTSAIHHLTSSEKQIFYQRCHEGLAPGGVLVNGDEIRPEDDGKYLQQCRSWVDHMHRVMEAGLVPKPMQKALRDWESRNVGQFGQKRVSGDDCHETITAQLEYLFSAGFEVATCAWQKDMWAILYAAKGRRKSR